MEIKKWTVIISTFFITMACNQKTFTLDEVKGTYYEVETKHYRWKKGCSLVVTDSTVTLRNCRLLKDFTGIEPSIVENQLFYLMRFSIHDPDSGLSWRQGIGRQNDTVYKYYTSFEIFKKDGVIHLYQSVDDNLDVTFRKIK